MVQSLGGWTLSAGATKGLISDRDNGLHCDNDDDGDDDSDVSDDVDDDDDDGDGDDDGDDYDDVDDGTITWGVNYNCKGDKRPHQWQR